MVPEAERATCQTTPRSNGLFQREGNCMGGEGKDILYGFYFLDNDTSRHEYFDSFNATSNSANVITMSAGMR